MADFQLGVVRSRRRRRTTSRSPAGSHADLRAARARPRARLPVADRPVRRRAARAPFDRYLFQVDRGRRRLRRPRASLEHEPPLQAATSCRCRAMAEHRPTTTQLPRPREPRVLPQLERQADQAARRSCRTTSRAKATRGSSGRSKASRRTTTTSRWCAAASIDRRATCELLGRTITSVLRAPGRHVQSVADSSFDAWIKFYRPDENSPNAVRQLLRQGRARGARARSRRCAATARVARRPDARALAAPRANRHRRARGRRRTRLRSSSPAATCRDFFARYVDGTEDPPLARAARRIRRGARTCARRRRKRSRRQARQGRHDGPRCMARASRRAAPRQTLQHVFAGGPAERAGLAAGDIARRDRRAARVGRRAREAARAAAAAASTVAVHAFRRDELDAIAVDARRGAGRHLLARARCRADDATRRAPRRVARATCER